MDVNAFDTADVYGMSEEELALLEEALFGEVYEPLQKYCPQKPFPKQRELLNRQEREVFFGGSAGPGKSSALLMAALRYVHVPQYSCLILRRDYARLSLPGSIMSRAKEWLSGTDARWSQQTKTWTFPSGAQIQFGYIDNPNDRFRYASSEFQRIIYDELTEFQLADDESNPYLFLFSRLRKTSDNPVPLQVIAASNPGNIGHPWVKKRFITQEATDWMMENTDEIRVFHPTPDRVFIPAVLRDNPAINPDEYIPSLEHLPKVTRERLLKGDWSIREDSLIPAADLMRYEITDGTIAIYDATGELVASWHESESYRFATCDPAGTSQDRAKSARGREHSWSVIGVWDKSPAHVGRFLVCRNVWRRKVGFNSLCDALRQTEEEWQTTRIRIENEKLGEAAVDVLADEISIDTVPTGGKDKVTRAGPLMQMIERHEFALPRAADWLDVYESELLTWTGHPDEQADQVDMSAYAAIEAQGRGLGIWPPELFGPAIWLDAYPVPSQIVSVVLPVRPEDLGQGRKGAVVTVGVRGDGLFYVDCEMADEPFAAMLERVRTTEVAFGRIAEYVVVPASSVEMASLLLPSVYYEATLTPTVFGFDLERSQFRDPAALTQLVTERRFRLRRGSAGCRTLAARFKAFPHTKEIAAMQAIGLAIETLAINR